MKQLFLLLLLACFTAGTVQAQSRPKPKAKRAFSHNSESGRDKASKAQFRRETVRPVIELRPHSLERSKTVKAPKPYKYSNGNKLKRAR